MKWKRQAMGFLTSVLHGAVTCIFAGMTVLTILLVVLRYFFNSSIPGGNEILRFAFMYSTFLGAAVLIAREEHIAIHLLTCRFPKAVQRVIGLLGDWLVIAMHVYLLILSFRWIAVTGGNLAEELDFPMKYVQVALPIGAGLAALYAFSHSIDVLFEWNRKKESPK